MIEVRFHSKKRQGAIYAAKILAKAYQLGGLDASWHIPTAWERGVNFEATKTIAEGNRDSPVKALVIMYSPLLEIPDIWMGFEHPDIVLLNTSKKLDKLKIPNGVKVLAVNVVSIARATGFSYILPASVAPMLGALTAVTGTIHGTHLVNALYECVPAMYHCPQDRHNIMKSLKLGYSRTCMDRGKGYPHYGDSEVKELLRAS